MGDRSRAGLSSRTMRGHIPVTSKVPGETSRVRVDGIERGSPVPVKIVSRILPRSPGELGRDQYL